MIAFLLLMLLQVTAVPKASITGSVVDAGTAYVQPLFHARVELLRDSQSVSIVRTDTEGRFAFSDLPAGRYRLAVTEDGFIRKMPSITVAAGQRSEISIALESAPTITGKIKNEYNVAAPDILVEAMKVVYGPRGDRSVRAVVSALTDDLGEYHLYWLDPGDYYIRASSLPAKSGFTIPGNPPGVASRLYAPIYYPGSPDPKYAAKIPLRVGSRMNGFDIQMQQSNSVGVAGYIYIEATGEPVGTRIQISPAGESASSKQYSGQSVPKSPLTSSKVWGSYAIGGMPPGTYIVSAQYFSEGEPLTVTRKTSLKVSERSLVLQLSPGSDVSGRLVSESGAALDLRSAHVSLESTDPDLPSPAVASADSNGQFAVSRVSPGSYAIRVSGLPGDAYVKSARSGERDVRAQNLQIDWKSPEPIRIVLGVDGGRLDGMVLDRADRPFAEAQVVLVPNEARRGLPDQFRAGVGGEDGQFSLRGIPPGEYRLFAWQEVEANAYMDANFMAGQELMGVPVTIGAEGSSRISVRVIPLD